MTAFAGVVVNGQACPQSGVAQNILSYIVAPNCGPTKCVDDSFIDFAVRPSDDTSDFLVDEKLCVIACGRLDETDNHFGSIPTPEPSRGLAKRLAIAYEKWGETLVHHVSG